MRDCLVGVSTIVGIRIAGSRIPGLRILILKTAVAISIVLTVAGCGSEAPSGRGTFPPGYWVSPLKTKSLDGWKVLSEGEFSSAGEVHFVDDSLVLEAGNPMTGIAITAEDFPSEDYEVKLEAKRIEGGDFFCGMTFAVGNAHCTFVVGGWDGVVVGLSNVDDFSANENMTTTDQTFEDGRWYAIHLRVTRRIEAWIDGDQVVDLDRLGREFSIWPEQDPARPFGIATYFTKATIRNLQVRRLIEM